MGFGDIIPVAGVTLSWGTTRITATSFNVSCGAEAEIDTTYINAASVRSDPNNTQRKLMVKSVDYAVIDLGELTCEFVGPGAITQVHLIATKRPLTIAGPVAGAAPQAYLTNMSAQFQAGDLVRGSCTFRLSNS